MIGINFNTRRGLLDFNSKGAGIHVILKPADKTRTSRIIGSLFALMFPVAAWFFWHIPLAGGEAVPVLRLVLCGGLSLIGVVIIWFALGPQGPRRFVEADPDAGEIRWGTVGKTGTELLGRMRLPDITKLVVGDGTDRVANSNYVSALYVWGEGTPRNRFLIHGTRRELWELRRMLLELRDQHRPCDPARTGQEQPT